MHLVNTSSLQLEEFEGNDIPPYAILSHTWEAEEVKYEEFVAITTDSHASRSKGKQGYRKILGAARLAASRNLKYIWIDTCC